MKHHTKTQTGPHKRGVSKLATRHYSIDYIVYTIVCATGTAPLPKTLESPSVTPCLGPSTPRQTVCVQGVRATHAPCCCDTRWCHMWRATGAGCFMDQIWQRRLCLRAAGGRGIRSQR